MKPKKSKKKAVCQIVRRKQKPITSPTKSSVLPFKTSSGIYCSHVFGCSKKTLNNEKPTSDSYDYDMAEFTIPEDKLDLKLPVSPELVLKKTRGWHNNQKSSRENCPNLSLKVAKFFNPKVNFKKNYQKKANCLKSTNKSKQLSKNILTNSKQISLNSNQKALGTHCVINATELRDTYNISSTKTKLVSEKLGSNPKHLTSTTSLNSSISSILSDFNPPLPENSSTPIEYSEKTVSSDKLSTKVNHKKRHDHNPSFINSPTSDLGSSIDSPEKTGPEILNFDSPNKKKSKISKAKNLKDDQIIGLFITPEVKTYSVKSRQKISNSASTGYKRYNKSVKLSCSSQNVSEEFDEMAERMNKEFQMIDSFHLNIT